MSHPPAIKEEGMRLSSKLAVQISPLNDEPVRLRTQVVSPESFSSPVRGPTGVAVRVSVTSVEAWAASVKGGMTLAV